MPSFQRRVLRQTLGLEYLRDLTIGTSVYGIQPSGIGSINLVDINLADLSSSGQGLYQGAWARILTIPTYGDYRVATFNAGSGAFISYQVLRDSFVAGANPFEIHEIVSPTEKDRAIDDAIRRVRIRREVGIASVDGLLFYTMDNAASPNTIVDVLDVYFYANPGGSLNLMKRTLDWTKVVNTATGNVIQIAPALSWSQQLILDAILEVTLGNLDTDVVTLPDDRWILSGAAARCYDLLAARAPSTEVALIKQRRAEMAAQYTRLSTRFQPQIDRRIRFDDPGL